MRRPVVILGLILVGLALLVPLSSERPDPVQHLLSVSGGVESAARALAGIGLALLAGWGAGYLLSRKKR